MASGYSHPEVLCETDWVASNLNNQNIKILEVDYDPENAYRPQNGARPAGAAHRCTVSIRQAAGACCRPKQRMPMIGSKQSHARC